MPRPLSSIEQEPSRWMVTVTSMREAGQRLVDGVVDDLEDAVVQAALIVSPMYMSGRLRTPSRPSSFWILEAS
jgi:hypothetical protein